MYQHMKWTLHSAKREIVCLPGKLNVNDEELDEMLNEGKGPINFTVFLSLFGEKINGGRLFCIPKKSFQWYKCINDEWTFDFLQVLILKIPYLQLSSFLTQMGRVLLIKTSKI